MIPLFSRRSLPAWKCVSFKLVFCLRAVAIISPPSGPNPQLVTLRIFRFLSSFNKHSNALIPSGPNALSLKSISISYFGNSAKAITSRERGISALKRLTKMLLKSIVSKFGVSYDFISSATHSHALKPYELPPRVILVTLDKSAWSELAAALNAALTSSAESNFLASAFTKKWFASI